MNRPIRRNDIVIEPRGGSYGRVWRVLTPEHVLVITAGKHIYIAHPDDLVRDGYKGNWSCYGQLRERFPVFHHMTSLRKLKQRARGYNPDVFAHSRPHGRLPKWTHGRGRYESLKKEYMGRPD